MPKNNHDSQQQAPQLKPTLHETAKAILAARLFTDFSTAITNATADTLQMLFQDPIRKLEDDSKIRKEIGVNFNSTSELKRVFLHAGKDKDGQSIPFEGFEAIKEFLRTTSQKVINSQNKRSSPYSSPWTVTTERLTDKTPGKSIQDQSAELLKILQTTASMQSTDFSPVIAHGLTEQGALLSFAQEILQSHNNPEKLKGAITDCTDNILLAFCGKDFEQETCKTVLLSKISVKPLDKCHT